VVIHAAERAGLSPLPIMHLHTFAYLSNVLAPVWQMPVMDGRLLKRRGGPFYPMLQGDLDSLVGIGVAIISNLSHVLDEQNRWRLEGSYVLNRDFSDRILQQMATFDEERRLFGFLQELAFAISSLSNEDLASTTTQDATYSDPIVDFDNVLDFAEWQSKNYTANAANYFERLLPGGVRANSSEKIHLYLRHLRVRIHGGH